MSEVEFKLKGVDYKIPNFLTVDHYTKIFKIKDLFEDEYMNAKVISIVTDCPVEHLLAEKNYKVSFLAAKVFSLFPKDNYPLYDRFELDGKHYGFIPSYKELTFAEFADLDTLLTKKPEEIMDYQHIIAAILYRPIISEKNKHNFKIEPYNQESLTDRSELFKEKLDIKYPLGGQFFFINFARMSFTSTPISLKQRIMNEWFAIKLLWTNRRNLKNLLLKKDLDGTSSLIDLQITTSMNMIKSLRKKLLKS